MSDDPPHTVEDALKLIRETQEALKRADRLLSDLARGKPSILSELFLPTLRLRERLLGELDQLGDLATKL